MPIVEVTCSSRISVEMKQSIVESLPHVVSVAVACDAEPYDGNLQPGDVLITFHDSQSLDHFNLDLLVEVKSKWFEDRATDRQRRSDAILDGLSQLLPPNFFVGVYLTLPVAAWSQNDVSAATLT